VVQGTQGMTPFIRAGNRPIGMASAITLLACVLLRRRGIAGAAGSGA